MAGVLLFTGAASDACESGKQDKHEKGHVVICVDEHGNPCHHHG
jgi:hypothetical protein